MSLFLRFLSGLILLLTSSLALAAPSVHVYYNGTDSRLKHNTGYARGLSWTTDTGRTKNTYLTFGPYLTGLGAGTRIARFTLAIDNVSADDAQVAVIEVYDAQNKKMLAQKGLTRKQFPGAYRAKDFDLTFTSASNSNLEFRIFYTGVSYLSHTGTTVLREMNHGTRQRLNTQIQKMQNSIIDWVIQDVCVDANDKIVAGDPATCSRHRNIRIGEKVPYIVTDFDKTFNKTYQAVSSYPVVGSNNGLRVVTAKNMQTNFTSDFKFSFSEKRDGYDLTDVSGNLLSFIRTSDGGCFDQKFSSTSGERRYGWILFGLDRAAQALTHSIILERLTPTRPASCGAYGSSNEVRTVWNAPANVKYESGKTLSSIVSYHYAHWDMGRVENALERYHFTREYGFTKWEAWIPLSRCHRDYGSSSPRCNLNHANNGLKGRCSPATGLANWGNQTWIRTDCRDTTFYKSLKTPMLPLTSIMGRTNGLIDVNYTATLNGP